MSMNDTILICPVCGEPLLFEKNTARCGNRHGFDIAREGYINLLRSNRSGDQIGDSKQSARSRRDFLDKGYYSPLKIALTDLFTDKKGSVLDICCGEGYYTSALAENPSLSVYGFDISKEMVRLASKRGKGKYFVANLAAIPVADASFDYAVHLFAPFQEKEFYRILKAGGKLYTVIPGRTHLYGLKQAVYDMPYFNDEKLPEVHSLQLNVVHKVTAQIELACSEDIQAVFQMTPYYYRTSPSDKVKLNAYHSLKTEISFVIAEYVKP